MTLVLAAAGRSIRSAVGNNMNFEYPKLNRFEIKTENIIPLTELPKDFSPKLKSLGWPLEVQGTGRILEDGKNFEVRYPSGDLFYSWAVIIHELGHLRQDELNQNIANEPDEFIRNLKKEKDAFARGLDRVKKYSPDILKKLDDEFKKFKAAGKIPDFDSFSDLFDDFHNIVRINEALGLEENDDIKFEKLKAINIEDFFRRIENNKIGIKINTKEAEQAILMVATEIAKE
jgi:hypothetical protein